MSETDNPLKLLITEYRDVFAAWLLHRAVRHVRPLNVEFPAQGARSDLLFEVTDQAGDLIYLHIELQGPRSPEPMPLRMLDYLARIIRREIGIPTGTQAARLHSVVIYVGEGAGRDDSGQYEVLGLGGVSSIRWQYEPLRLWEMEAEALLALDNPALWALIGQTRMPQPEQVLPQAIAGIRQIDETQHEKRLLAALVSLLPNEEVIKMVEKFLEQDDELLLDTPYLRKMRRIGWEQGLQEGRVEGAAEGRAVALREAILDGIVYRFNPLASEYRDLQAILEQITSSATLRLLHNALFSASDFAAFRAWVSHESKE